MEEVKEEKKRILLIAPVFFGYYKEMLKEIKRQGYDADYICDMPSNSNVLKAVGRINKKLTYGVTEKYFKNEVLPKISKEKYDYVILVAGMTFAFSAEMMEKIRELQKGAKFAAYQWDSEKNLPYSTGIHKFFDKIYTFDRPDSIAQPEKYTFLPLFYLPEYAEIAKDKAEILYDCSYIGTAHPRKYKEINEISGQLKELLPRQFIFHYMPSKLKYIYHKIKAPEYKNAKFSDFETEKLSKEETLEIIKKSFCVLDAPQGGQTGLTIRTIECLGAEKKLITTNGDIKNYDFYDEANILVFESGMEISAEDPFFSEAYHKLSEEIYKKYSLESWIKTLIEG